MEDRHVQEVEKRDRNGQKHRPGDQPLEAYIAEGDFARWWHRDIRPPGAANALVHKEPDGGACGYGSGSRSSRYAEAGAAGSPEVRTHRWKLRTMRERRLRFSSFAHIRAASVRKQPTSTVKGAVVAICRRVCVWSVQDVKGMGPPRGSFIM